MFPKSKSWMSGSGGVFKPKNPHSLEHLKYLYGVLGKNQTVTEQNLSLLVETLRSISEILIWGDQNDSSVFDFFLEKNMLVFFLKFMRQRSGQCICVQLLQTLNILFDNITNETSVYYLLSNNHINSIIIHKFDFSDEEVMAYYISFLKTLSMKLNKHTIHFFYNEHTNDFALYTEAIKFFNHSESMVRIAVRTITLNVYRVDDRSMLRYIRDKTAAPYFSNLVWFIGNHVLELDLCVKQDIDHNSRSRLSDLVAEHLDHLHYLNDILCLNIDALNEVLTDHLLNRLLIPLYVKSLLPSQTDSSEPSNERTRTDDSPRIDPTVSLFLLSQVFLIMHHAMLVRQLADIIFNGDISVCENRIERESAEATKLRCFVKPEVPLAQILENCRLEAPRDSIYHEEYLENEIEGATAAEAGASSVFKLGQFRDRDANQDAETSLPADDNSDRVHRCLDPHPNSTDEEKLMQNSTVESILQIQTSEFNLDGRPFLEAVFSSLDCSKDDYKALFSLCLLYALGHNSGINQDLLDVVHMPTDLSQTKHHYNTTLVQQLINIMSLACQNNSKIRLATLELTILLVRTLAYKEGHCFLQDCHLAEIEGVREEATLQLRNFYKSEEIFLDMFEDEHRELLTKPLNVEYLTMDASILLHPTGTPLTGIDFCRRLPCGEVERARRAIRVFFVVRDLSFALRQEPETELPLTKDSECAKVNDVLDLNNSDLIACTVVFNENKKERRFLVIDVIQLILVEPDPKRLGWGVVRFVGFLQDAEVTGDKEDSRCLHVTIHKPTMNFAHGRPQPLLVARFVFDDHIRCMAARQRLTKGRLKARQRKMQMIARLLDLPSHLVDSIYPQQGNSGGGSHSSSSMLRPGSASAAFPGQAQRRRTTPVKDVDNQSQSSSSKKSDSDSRDSIQRSVFASVNQVPAFNMAAKEQDHERRSRRLKAKLAGSIARQQLMAKNLQASGAEGSTSQQSAEAKKMYLSMAKEAKRSYQMRALNKPADQSSSNEEKVSTDIAAKGILRPRSAMLPDRSSSLPESPNRGKLRSCLPVPVKAGSLEICTTVDQHRERERTRSESAEISVKTDKDDKVRKLSGPKSLSQADGIPVSLIDLCVDDHLASSSASTFLDSPIKLLPPAQADDIRKFASGETAENVDLSTGMKQPQSDLELPDSVE